MGKMDTKNKFFSISAVCLLSGALVSGCSYKSDCYNPKLKQSHEEKICYKYSSSPFENSRFIYLDDTLWMQYDYKYIIEARDFNVTVNDKNETHTADKFLVLPSDHPLEKFSNLLINVDFLKYYDKIDSLTYEPLNPNSEMGKEKLWGINLWALNRFLRAIKQEHNITKKEELNITSKTQKEEENKTQQTPQERESIKP